MRGTLQRATVTLALFFVSSAFGEVIFSRRVNKEHGASYQPIFTYNPADGVLKELTHSPRDHYHPTCDGRIVKFTSPSPDVTDDVKLWSLNPVTGEERVVGRAPEPRGRPDSQSRSCEQFAKVGEFEACGNEETLVVSRSGRQIGRFQIQVNICPINNHGTIGKGETPIRSLDWTEDGKWPLIGEEGLNDGSGQRQDDYYLVNLATMKLSTVASVYHDYHELDQGAEAITLGGPREAGLWPNHALPVHWAVMLQWDAVVGQKSAWRR